MGRPVGPAAYRPRAPLRVIRVPNQVKVPSDAGSVDTNAANVFAGGRRRPGRRH